MARFRVVLESKGQGMKKEFMLVGNDIDDALRGAKVLVYEKLRTRVDTDHKGNPCPPFYYDRLMLAKQFNLDYKDEV